MERWQISLRRLLGTVTLFCLVGLALQLVAWTVDTPAYGWCLLSIFPLTGAAVGSLFKRTVLGAVAGCGAIAAMYFLLPALH
ncbi:MAG: hypothetical protein AB7U73_03580 [Pirellulales bacterium]